MASYGVDYLNRLLDGVSTFQHAFEAWMRTQVEGDHMSSKGLFPTAWPREDADPAEIQRLELDLAEAAGVASRAVAVTGAQYYVQGMGTIDPIANWAGMRHPKALFTASDIRTSTAAVKGRLAAMIADAEAEQDSDLPAFSPALLHPIIWTAAAPQWTAHQYRVAVREAAEGLNLHWKAKLGRHNVDDTSFWQQTLSPGEPTSAVPKLAWPGDPEARTTKSMRGGLGPLAGALNSLATGMNLTVRNVATHSADELSEQEAMERLAAYSFLARLLDGCEVRTADETETTN